MCTPTYILSTRYLHVRSSWSLQIFGFKCLVRRGILWSNIPLQKACEAAAWWGGQLKKSEINGCSQGIVIQTVQERYFKECQNSKWCRFSKMKLMSSKGPHFIRVYDPLVDSFCSGKEVIFGSMGGTRKNIEFRFYLKKT